MINVVIFDFDGVIVESADIKTDAFAEVFSDHPKFQEEILMYHKNNMGISRYVKFKYFYEQLLHRKYTDEIGEALSKKFSDIVVQKIIKAPFVRGALDFFELNWDKRLLFIASGTPEKEIQFICEKKGITKYFTEIYGSPEEKDDIIKKIMKQYTVSNQEIIYVGDAMSDYNAAFATGAHFVGRTVNKNNNPFPVNTQVIENLVELQDKIKALEVLS